MLYQLSYTPKKQILSFIELPYEHRDTALETTALPTELYPYLFHQISIAQKKMFVNNKIIFNIK